MNKKRVLLILLILVVVLAAGGFFWWDKIENYLDLRETKKIFAFAENYTIQNLADEKFIENEKDGFKAKVPEKWIPAIGVDIFGLDSERRNSLYSPDYNLSPLQGCAIEIEIVRAEKEKEGFLIRSASEVKEDIAFYKDKKPEGEEYKEIIYVNGREALKDVGKKSMIIEIPTKDKVYIFRSVLASENCLTEFYKFLETVSIK